MHFDNRFHIAIARATENRFLLRSATDIRTALNDALWVSGSSRAWLGRIVAEDDRIVAANRTPRPTSRVTGSHRPHRAYAEGHR